MEGGSGCADKVYAFVAVYVDDILITGEDSVTQAPLRRFQEQWKRSSPEWLSRDHGLRFCGFEISQEPQGIRLHQNAYLKDLLARQVLRFEVCGKSTSW